MRRLSARAAAVCRGTGHRLRHCFLFRKILPVNQTTVALTLLLAILAVSTVWGFAVSAFMSVAAMLAFNYYFLPPIGTLTISRSAELGGSVRFSGGLADRQPAWPRACGMRREEAQSAPQARSSGCTRSASNCWSPATSSRCSMPFPTTSWKSLAWARRRCIWTTSRSFITPGSGGHFDEEEMKRAMAARRTIDRRRAAACASLPCAWDRAPSAAWAFPDALLSRQTLEALGTLIAVAFERARAVEELGKTEASREGERLKSALLDSVTHDFRTPLTSIKASVTSLLSAPGERNPAAARTAHRDRRGVRPPEPAGGRRRGNGASGRRRIRAASWSPIRMADIVCRGAAAVQERLWAAGRCVWRSRRICRKVRADFVRIKDVLVRLIENANAYTPADQPITISAEVSERFCRRSAWPIAVRESRRWR